MSYFYKNRILLQKIFFFFIFLSPFLGFGQTKSIQYGKASYYADFFEGRITANGETYSQSGYTAAHNTLPFGTKVKVTNRNNNKSIVVRINDRGPFAKGRIIDLTKEGAKALDFVYAGVTSVVVEIVEYKAKSEYCYTNKNYFKKPKAGKTESVIKPAEVKPVDSALIIAKVVDLPKTVEVKKTNSEKCIIKKVELLQNSIKENIFYSLSSDTLDLHGFGVQLGSFKDFKNLTNLSKKALKKCTTSFSVQSAMVNNVLVYRLIAGELPDKENAENLRKILQADFPNCFIVNFENLNNKTQSR
ncbi:MAG: septal ring lytic transglycosylase RlpA family protein [Bacteroidetes bacterium]|nr:septal ring lytic transglycosylase RlpA family protein [Bacteroidota bacterium]